MNRKLSLLALCITLSGCSHTAYSGQVSEIRQTKGGLVIDLDGTYPNQEMVVYIPHSAEYKFAVFPNIGDMLAVEGEVTLYRGRREIVVTSPDQMKH